MNFGKKSWITPVTFEYSLKLISQNEKVIQNSEKTIAVEKPLAVASTRLSTGNSHRTFSKVFESVTQPFQLLLAASSFGQFFKNFLGIKTFFIISRAFHITRKLWRKTGLTVVVSLYTHICYPAEYHAKFLTVEH